MSYPHEDVYNWSTALSAEQKTVFGEEFLSSTEVKTIIRRLKISQNNMIAVIGNQGSGKTTVKANIFASFEDEDGNVPDNIQSFKWSSIEKMYEIIINPDVQAEYRSSILNEPKIVKMRRGTQKLEGYENFSQIEMRVNRARRQELMWEAFMSRASGDQEATFLIDFPDYDKKNRRKMLQDIDSFREWWDTIVLRDNLYGDGMTMNIVVFFQKELWGTHFYDGKFDVVELKPFTPTQLKDHYIQLFVKPTPFTEEALVYLAGLARGIIRWFKKYIRLCLDTLYNYMDEGKGFTPITIDHVKEWVTLAQISEDWERELMEILPKSRGSRVKAVKIIRLLYEKGDALQSDIRKQYFGDDEVAETACSRLLSKLEEAGYITRDPEGKEKIIKLVTLS
jgi:DNA-binding transcriptional ArsR family regulator/energy-coupling factor transporter ATP-binding protein EcfA2